MVDGGWMDVLHIIPGELMRALLLSLLIVELALKFLILFMCFRHLSGDFIQKYHLFSLHTQQRVFQLFEFKRGESFNPAN